MLPLDGFRPIYTRYNEPIPVPATDPGETPGSSVTLNCEWWSYVLGAVQHLLDQGVWRTNDQTEMSNTIARVYQLISLIIEAGNAGDCASADLSCEYDFTSTEANPWISSPTLTETQTTWSILGLGWVGGNSSESPEFWAQATIQADYIPFTVNAFSVTFGGPPVPCCGENWAIRFYDHGLNLLHEVADTGGTTASYSGPLSHVCRIMVNRRADNFAGTLQPTIQSIAMTGFSFEGACEQLVPLADPPVANPDTDWTSVFDFTVSDWQDVLSGLQGTWEAGVGIHSVATGFPFSCQAVGTSDTTMDPVKLTFTRVVYDGIGGSGSNSGVYLYNFNPSENIHTDAVGSGSGIGSQDTTTYDNVTQAGFQINTGASCNPATVKQWIVSGKGDKPSGWP